jgi:phosphatidylserine decarboxylase
MQSFAIPPIHPEGPIFLGLFALATAVLFWIWTPLGWVGVVATIWCAYFFRDPQRVTPMRDGLVVAPADGVIQAIQPAALPPDIGLGEAARTRISIFMNVFNVHVNRAPIDGEVVALAYRPGKFLNASLDKASVDNERHAVHIRGNDGHDLVVVQIAGLVARRIKCDLVARQKIRAGERFGIIRFGSRVDVYLPDGVAPLVSVGQLTIGGETVLADMKSQEGPRLGEVH